MKLLFLVFLVYANSAFAAPQFGGFGSSGRWTWPSWPSTSKTTTKTTTPTPITTSPISTNASPTPIATTTPAPSPSASSSPGSGATCSSQTAPSSSNTENGVLDKKCCTPLTVIFARGTSESGNVGTVAGPPLFKALRNSLGVDKVTIQGVAYPATAQGNANMGADGGPTLASLVKQALSQCPSTKVVVSGYSQGGSVVHNGAAKQGLTADQLSAAVLFGDPLNGQAVGNVPSSKVKQFCANGDHVCDGSGTYSITQAHTTYGNNAQEAASFIIQVTGV